MKDKNKKTFFSRINFTVLFFIFFVLVFLFYNIIDMHTENNFVRNNISDVKGKNPISIYNDTFNADITQIKLDYL